MKEKLKLLSIADLKALKDIAREAYNSSETEKGKTTYMEIAMCCAGIFPYTANGEIEAAKAYDRAALKYRGDFANLNFK